MSSGHFPVPETVLATPLPCWHESLHAARTDLIVGLSPRRARIASGRPVPAGMPVFLELGRDAGIDAIAVASDADAFVVEFVTVDDAAAALIEQALQPVPSTLPRTRTDELGLPASAPVELPPFAVEPPVALPASERTGEFLAADVAASVEWAAADAGEAPVGVEQHGLDEGVVQGHLVADLIGADAVTAAAAPPPPVDDAPSWIAAFLAPVVADASATAQAIAVDDAPATAQAIAVSDAPAPVEPTTTPDGDEVPTPSWVRAFDADLGDEPELPVTGHTQRWPTAHAASSSEGDAATPTTATPTTATTTAATTTAATTTAPTTPPGWLGEATPERHEQAWPTAPLAVAPSPSPAAMTPTMRPPGLGPSDDDEVATTRWPAARVATPTPAWLGEDTPEPVATPTPAPAAARAAPPPAEETARWPVARVAVATPTMEPRPTTSTTPTAPPPLSFDDAEDVVLEFTAPPRPAHTSRPLPPPERGGDVGVVEVDFTEFKDVLGVATFKADAPRPVSSNGRVSTPPPVSIALPRTPSASHVTQAPVRNPFAGDSGVGPRPDSTPPLAPDALSATVDEQWVVSSPSLPAPRLLDRGLDRLLRSGGPNSVTPQPLPFVHDSTPPATTPAVTPTTTVAPTPTTLPPTPTPRLAVSPPPAIVAPRPPSVVPVVPPRPPPVLAPPPPRPTTAVPVASTLPPTPPASVAAPVVAATPAPAPAAAWSALDPPPITANETEAVTAPGGGVQVLPLTSSAEDLPVVLGDGEDITLD